MDFSSYKDIVNRSRVDLLSKLPKIDGTVFFSGIRAVVDSISGRHYDHELLLRQMQKDFFPSEDSSEEALRFWLNYESLTPFAKKKSSGGVVFVGLIGSEIALDTEFTSTAGDSFKADSSGAIGTKNISISSLERVGLTATATTTSDHGFASFIDVDMSGVIETEYNGTFKITVLDANRFSYTISGSPTTPATGTIIASCDCVTIFVISTGFGANKNLDLGAKLTSVEEITGIESIGYVDALGVLGGEDDESKASMVKRIKQSRGNPVANFNPAAIEKVMLSIQGTTRVKVKRVYPAIGDVTVLFMRDEDDNPIPSASRVAEMKARLIEDLPATSSEGDIYALAPTGVSVDFTFSSIAPDTKTMRTAIGNSLKAFFEDIVDFEVPIAIESYKTAIQNAIDTETGDILSSYTLATPIAEISISDNEIGILGNVTFA